MSELSTYENIEIILDPPCIKRDLEFVYDDKGKKILGWQWRHWYDARDPHRMPLEAPKLTTGETLASSP